MQVLVVGGPFVATGILLSNTCCVCGYVVIVLGSAGLWRMSWVYVVFVLQSAGLWTMSWGHS